MNLEREDRELLQKNLSGMKAGFTLMDSTLHLRVGSCTFSYVLYEIEDRSKVTCGFCGDQIYGKPWYWATQTTELPIGEKSVVKIPLCPDCGCPK